MRNELYILAMSALVALALVGCGGSDARMPLNHRSAAASCPSQRGPGPGCESSFWCSSSCSADSQCIDGVDGRCFPFEGLVGPGGCSYDECYYDSDCGAKTPCTCRGSSTDNSANICDVGGNCAVDSDCGLGGYCSPSTDSCYSTNPDLNFEAEGSSGPSPYFCHTAADLCINDSDCGQPDAGMGSCPVFASCAYDVQDTRWECTQYPCCPP